jgi:O-antigen/teichoic acid export membrane protein
MGDFRGRLSHAAAFQAISSASAAAFSLGAAFVLVAEERGELAAGMSTATLAIGFATLGIPNGVLYFAGKSRKPVGGASAYLPHLAVAVAVSWAVGAVYLSRVAPGLGTFGVSLFGVAVAGGTAMTVSQWLLMGAGSFRSVTKARSLTAVLLTVATAGLVTNPAFADLTSVDYLLVWVAASTAGAVLMVTAARRAWAVLTEDVPAQAFWQYNTRAYPGSLLQIVTSRADVAVLALVAPLADVGVYAVALGVADVLLIPPQALASVALPDVSAGGLPAIAQLQTRVHRWLFVQVVLTGGLLVGLLILNGTLLGDSYEDLVPVVCVLAAGNLCLGATRVLLGVLGGLNRPADTTTVGAVTVLVMIPAVLTLGAEFGALGAASGSVVAYCCGLGAALVLMARARRRADDPVGS